jgi:hypothetical protein
MEKRRRHVKGREIITATLATVATIHAAHGVYSSMEAHEKRHKLVAEGEMSLEEARKKQTKAFIQDAAAVGIAALGIKGAFSEWKEMNEQRCVYVLHLGHACIALLLSPFFSSFHYHQLTSSPKQARSPTTRKEKIRPPQETPEKGPARRTRPPRTHDEDHGKESAARGGVSHESELQPGTAAAGS